MELEPSLKSILNNRYEIWKPEGIGLEDTEEYSLDVHFWPFVLSTIDLFFLPMSSRLFSQLCPFAEMGHCPFEV